MFALALITASKDGKQLWIDVKSRISPTGMVDTHRGKRTTYQVECVACNQEEELPSGVLCESTDILYLLEMLLAFYAWYKYGHPFSVNTLESFAETEEAIRILLQTIKELTPRNNGNGWKLQIPQDLASSQRHQILW